MELTLKRTALKSAYTIGHLYIDGKFFCDTIEDKVRNLAKEAKVQGETAIPYGTYKVTLGVQSPRFSKSKTYASIKGYLPRLVDVPGFSGVLIHIGNVAADTEGCILVGENKEKGKVLNSKNTFWRLYPILEKAYKSGEEITISII